jgi:hypothetical protein
MQWPWLSNEHNRVPPGEGLRETGDDEVRTSGEVMPRKTNKQLTEEVKLLTDQLSRSEEIREGLRVENMELRKINSEQLIRLGSEIITRDYWKDKCEKS